MRMRDISISVRLTEDDAVKLRSYASQCGFTVSALIRILIRGRCSKPNPPEVFWSMLNELYDIYDSFRIIADSDVEVSVSAREAQKQTLDFILQLQAAVTLPQKAVMLYGGDEDMVY